MLYISAKVLKLDQLYKVVNYYSNFLLFRE